MSYINGVQHIGIPIDDFDKSCKFYENLGFQLINQENSQGNKVGFFELNGSLLEIFEDRTSNQTGAIQHIALDTDNIEKTYEWIQAMDVVMIDAEVQALPFWEKGIRYFNFYGPNHETIEICQKNK